MILEGGSQDGGTHGCWKGLGGDGGEMVGDGMGVGLENGGQRDGFGDMGGGNHGTLRGHLWVQIWQGEGGNKGTWGHPGTLHR